MIESTITTPIVLESNDSFISFPNDRLRTRSANCCGFLQHKQGSPIYKVKAPCQPGIYKIKLTGTFSSATTGIIALGIYEDGVLDRSSVGAQTLAAAGDVTNISIEDVFRVCEGDNTTIAVGAVPSVLSTATLTPTTTVAPTIINAKLILTKIK